MLAAPGYPDSPRTGDAIEGLERITPDAHPDCKVFHAGTALDGGRVVVSGGRVLCVTALGDSVRQAQRVAYAAVADIRFPGMQYRGDIGHRALAPRSSPAAGSAPMNVRAPRDYFLGLQSRIVARSRRSTGNRSGATSGRDRRAAAASRA